MSNYKNFVQDFPNRCREVLVAFSKPAVERERDVTLLLMAAAAGFVMPYERLAEGKGVQQPPLDRNKFEKARRQLQQLLRTTVTESKLFSAPGTSWRFGSLKSAEGTPDDWDDWLKLPQPDVPFADQRVSDVLTCLRNGLAHCNIFSRSRTTNHIDQLVFVSGGKYRKVGTIIPFTVLVVSPDDLRYFMLSWFKWLESVPIPHDIVLELLDDAA